MSSAVLVAMEYSQERTDPRPSKPVDALPRAHQRFLQGVLRVVHRAEHPVAVGPQLGLVGGGELAELVLVHQSLNVGSAPCVRGARPLGSSQSSCRPSAVRSSSE